LPSLASVTCGLAVVALGTMMIMIGARSLVAERKVLLIPEGLNGERVDAAVARMLGLPRSRVVDMIGAGHVLLDGASINKSDRVSVGSMLEVELADRPRLATVRPEQVEGVVIVYDDDDIVVIDKPVGVAAHPSLGWSGPDVLSHLAGAGFRISTSGVSERRGIVQRLDVGTSGLMVVAKSELAYTILKRAFRSRSVDKIYHALVQGHPDPFTGTIEAPIGRHPGADYKMAVMHGGRHSVTHYTTVEAFVAATLLEIKLETGRTHQIRVHMAAIRHPCVGDPVYGADPVLAARLGLERQWLHAVRLSFVHPSSGEEMQFESPYPPDLQHALEVVSAW
jgi:23S rRNA pseudouridine1911/1915/1917 synthase